MGFQQDAAILKAISAEAIDLVNNRLEDPEGHIPTALTAMFQQLVMNIPTFAALITENQAPEVAIDALRLSIQHHLWVAYEIGRRAQAAGIVLSTEN